MRGLTGGCSSGVPKGPGAGVQNPADKEPMKGCAKVHDTMMSVRAEP
jgi:hypothetical protein